MAGTRDDDPDDLLQAVRKEAWSLAGPTRVVKVTAYGVQAFNTAMGYGCQEKVLLGKTPADIEKALGLPYGKLSRGCDIYRLTRLPMASEVAYELTTQFPDGPAHE